MIANEVPSGELSTTPGQISPFPNSCKKLVCTITSTDATHLISDNEGNPEQINQYTRSACPQTVSSSGRIPEIAILANNNVHHHVHHHVQRSASTSSLQPLRLEIDLSPPLESPQVAVTTSTTSYLPTCADISRKLPFFTVTISIIQGIIYSVQSDLLLYLFEFNPSTRYQIWRFITFLLLHGSLLHLWGNLILQVILGCFLEIFCPWYHVALIYLTGVIFSALAGSTFHPRSSFIGASGGVCALLSGYLSFILLNWNRVKCGALRCFLLLITYVIFDFYLLLERFITGLFIEISHAGHIGGTLGGFVVGVNLFTFSQERRWESRLRNGSLLVGFVFMIVTSVANVYAQIYYFSGHREHSDSNHNSNGNTTLSNDYLQFLNNSEYYE